MKTIVGVLIVAALAAGSGCAKTDWIDRTLVTVDVTGTWNGSVGGQQGVGDVFLELDQQGQMVTGTLRLKAGQGDLSGPIEGTVAGDLFRFRNKRGNVGGELTVSGDEMTGMTETPMGSRPVSLRRVDPSPLPAAPPR
jgi:hypothetical protein